MKQELEVRPLSEAEKRLYANCKKIIADSIESCFHAGAALIHVSEGKLYREDFKTFEEFCQTVYQMGKSQAYRLMDAARVKESLPPLLADKITNESQARALAEVPEEKRETVVKNIVSAGKPITAKAISKMSPIGDKDQLGKTEESEKKADNNGSLTNASKPTPKVRLIDSVGTPIPDEALPYWEEKQEVQDLMTEISQLKSKLQALVESKRPTWMKLRNSVLIDIASVYTAVSEVKPYAVCTTCMGAPSLQPKGCSYCCNTGLISKFRWDTTSRKEVKEMRMKANAITSIPAGSARQHA